MAEPRQPQAAETPQKPDEKAADPQTPSQPQQGQRGPTPNTSAAEQPATHLGESTERLASPGKPPKFQRFGVLWEVHDTMDSGMVLCARVEDAQPKSCVLLEAPSNDEKVKDEE